LGGWMGVDGWAAGQKTCVPGLKSRWNNGQPERAPRHSASGRTASVERPRPRRNNARKTSKKCKKRTSGRSPAVIQLPVDERA
jgi:hypothetical protein